MDIIKKNELVEKVREELGVTKQVATTAVNAVFKEIADTLSREGVVDIAGFGKFEVKERAARLGVNPSKNERIMIPATKVVKFKPAKALKVAVK